MVFGRIYLLNAEKCKYFENKKLTKLKNMGKIFVRLK